MATNEKITLNVDLYDNIMTEQKGDYTGRARITGSLHNKEIAARIIKERTEYRQETIENILDLADQKKVEAIAEGKERGRRCGTVHCHRTRFVPRGERPGLTPRSTRSVCPTHRDNCCATSSKP
ncbi:hypothetical protein NXW75_25875 [Bacteroides xylanisolvens]|nr:hypothetical protein [Bacteroides xylanisolvens]